MISDEIKRSIADYLAQVKANLCDVSEETRDDVLRDVEAHIHDALRQRSSSPTLADLAAVLAEMDPPSSYSGESLGERTASSAPPPAALAPAPSMPQHHLSVPLYLILTIVTCGIFNLYWNYAQMQACNDLLEREEFSFGTWLLFSILTCGIYHLFYQYKMGSAIVEIQRKYGAPPFEALPVISVVVSTFAMSIIVDAIHQQEINKIVA